MRGILSLYGAVNILGLGWLANCLPDNPTNDQVNAPISAGTFQNPSANVRPRFRYWIPDASVDLGQVSRDIADAAGVGAGGVEALGYYFYGANPGDYIPVDWSKYGWGTPAWKELFDTLIKAHGDHGLVMDFAMGPNQGQGVPAHQDDDGLMWDLRFRYVSVPINGIYNGTLPSWGTGKFLYALTALVVNTEQTSSSSPSLPNSPPSSRTQKTLAKESLFDISDRVTADGHLEMSFKGEIPGRGHEHIIYAVYLVRAGLRAQASPTSLKGPQSKPQDFTQAGSFTVDHFSARGAKVVTDFWEKYLLTNGTKEALMKIGNYAWEDSQEFDEEIYWTKDLPTIFEARRGYSIVKWLPLMFHQNSLNEHAADWFITDEDDAGNSHIADYRTTITELNGEYLQALRDWAVNYLNIQFSAQVGYNLAIDMQSNIPLVNSPECECLAFSNSIDGYRQYTGPANLAGKRVISTECGATGGTYGQTLPELLWGFKRSLAGSVNNIVIHGYPYTGSYPNTTWPGFTTFTYAFAEMHGRRQPGWDFYSDAMGYIARLQYIFQSGVPKMDVAFYQKITTYHDVKRSYQPTDLEVAGYTYAYLNPDNFYLPAARVRNGILAPDMQGFKALIIRGTDDMTVPGVKKIVEFAKSGLPVIFSGGTPSYLASYNASGMAYVKQALDSISTLSNVHHAASDNLAQTIASLGIDPLTKVNASGTWYTYWRKNDIKSEDYVFVYNDTPSPTARNGISGGIIEFKSTGKPYLYNAWTGEQVPINIYTQTATTTKIFLALSSNQAVIVVFRTKEKPATHVLSFTGHILTVSLESAGLVAQVGNGGQSQIVTSDGVTHTIPGFDAKPIQLNTWTLTVEHWDAPSSASDLEPVRYNTTHLLSSLTSWQNIIGLQHVSGRGYYTTTLNWPPSNDATGAILSLGSIIHTVRVIINGHVMPPLELASASVDIGKYLIKGSNSICVVVSTTMANKLETLWDQLRTNGVPPTGAFGGPTKPPGNADYGLVDPVTITPYRAVAL